MINWEAIGALAELLAAVGVIGSLVYLGRQINANSENIMQNTKALISDRDVSSNESILALYRPQYENPELASLMMKGHASPDALDPTERYRYNFAVSATFESHQTFFIQHSKGVVSDELWDFYSSSMNRLCRVPGVIAWWNHNSSSFNPAFTQYIEEKIHRSI